MKRRRAAPPRRFVLGGTEMGCLGRRAERMACRMIDRVVGTPSQDERLRAMVQAIVAVVQPSRVILFGSRARGDARPDSDYIYRRRKWEFDWKDYWKARRGRVLEEPRRTGAKRLPRVDVLRSPSRRDRVEAR